MDLPAAVAGLSRGGRVLRPPGTLLRSARRLERRRPRAVQLEELGAVRQATARERDEVRLPVAPVGEGGRPFLRAPELERVPAGEDDAAVDDPRDDRGQLAGSDRHHRLVEQPKPILAAPESDQDMSLLVRREGEQVCVAVLPADGRGLRSGRRGGFEVTARLLLEHHRQQEVAALDPVGAALVEQPLRAAEPAARASDLSAAGEADSHPERAAKGLQPLAGGEVRAMGPLEQDEILGLAADHVGRGRQ